jgi:hypothetical protein
MNSEIEKIGKYERKRRKDKYGGCKINAKEAKKGRA